MLNSLKEVKWTLLSASLTIFREPLCSLNMIIYSKTSMFVKVVMNPQYNLILLVLG